MADLADYWIAEFTINDESHHLMVMQGAANKREFEAGMQRMIEFHTLQHPHLNMKIVKFVKMESPEQVDKMKADLYARFPNRAGAEILHPENPNALLFQPLVADYNEFASGRAEEALIRMLCGG